MIVNNNNSKSNFIEEFNLKDEIYKLTTQKSIKKWDIGASSSNDISVQVDKGNPKQLKASQRNQVTVRVWNKEDRIGITSTSDLSPIGLSKALDGALLASEYGNTSETPQFSPLAKDKINEIHSAGSKGQGIQKIFEYLQEAEEKLINSHPAIESVPYNGLAETNFARMYLNSEGALRYGSNQQASIYLYAKALESGRKPRSSGSIKIANSTFDLDIQGCIEEASLKTIRHLNYEPVKTDKYLVCFMPDAFLELINAFSNIFNARSIIDGISLSNMDSLGKKIAVPQLCIHDNALNPSNIGALNFDGEGTPVSRLCLIDDGALVNLLHSEATARKFGVNPTGHAGLGAKVSVGPDWLEISKSNNNCINKLEFNSKDYLGKFILIENLNALHAGVKASQGSFSLPFDGWLVDNQEMRSIEAATVAGDIRQLLQNIQAIEDTQHVTHMGISPHIWIDNLSITGEA